MREALFLRLRMPRTWRRVVAAAMDLLNAEVRELAQLDALDAVSILPAALRMRALDQELIPETLDVRRAPSIGWLADPA